MLYEEALEAINENIDIVEYVEQFIDLRKDGKIYRAICPFHDDKKTPSLVVYPETNSWHCFGCHKGSHIANFVQYYNRLSFQEAIKYLLKYINIDPSQIPKKPESIKVLEKIHRIKSDNIIEQVQNKKISEDFLQQYPLYIVPEWVQEGINAEVQSKYGIRIDPKRNRWLIPIRNENGELVVVKARASLSNWEKLGIEKYKYYKDYKGKYTNNVLFGLYYNHKYIKERNEIILFEGEKSVMKAESMGFRNAVALGTNCINKNLLPKVLQLHCDVVLALDKDIPIQLVKYECARLSMFSNVYYTYDKDNLLGKKDSPVDQGLGVWLELYNNKIKYN